MKKYSGANNKNMFEKFIGKPNAEKEESPERITELGEKILVKEAVLEIEPKRSGGFMLCTVLAMALAMGMTASKAEAQTGGMGEFGKQLVGNLIFKSGSVADRAQNAKQDGIEHEYVAQLTQLGDAERQLDYQYSRQKSLLKRQGGSPQDMKKLETDYQEQKAQAAQTKMELKKKYDHQIRNMKIRKAVTGTIFQGARGW